MESKQLNSLNIEGLGTYPGGEFDRVNISGKGNVTSDLKCQTLEISGVSTISGNAMSERTEVSGCGRIQGNMITEDLNVSGTLKCSGDVEAKMFYLNGMSTVKQCLKVTKLTTSGMLTVEGDISGEEVKVEGALNCKGLLNCETLEMSCVGTSILNEVGAANIMIGKGKTGVSGLLRLFVPEFLRGNRVVANVLEGDHIILENCEVKVVRGKNIRIKENCKIGTLEYSGELTVDDSSQVEMIHQI